MLYDKDTTEDLVICTSDGCGESMMVKLCQKCDRVLHDQGQRENDDDGEEKNPLLCIVCCDVMGLDETKEGVDFDWFGVYCCPHCGSFDITMRAKMEYWIKFNSETASYEKDDGMTEEEVEFRDGGSCYTCGHDWDNDDTVTGKEFATKLRKVA
jgi:hypothetical protein